MPNITCLPIETLQQIWSLIPTADIPNLSMACKVINDAGQRHRKEVYKRYKNFSLVRKTYEYDDENLDDFSVDFGVEFRAPPRLFSVLSDISNEPTLAEYVEEVQIDSCLSTWGLRGAHKRQFWTKAFGEVLASVMRDCAYLNCHDGALGMTEEAERCTRSIENGNEDLIIGLLLSLLPRIRIFRLRCTKLVPQICVSMIERIAGDPTATALSHLTTVKIDFNHGCYTSPQPLAMLAAFAALPSLRTLCAKNIGWVSRRPSEYPTNQSNVLDLALKRISINLKCLDRFLGMFKALEKFKCEFFVPRSSTLTGSIFKADDIISVLLHHTLQSLTHLTLYSRCNSSTWMGSLRQFTMLSHIRTDWHLLLDEANASEYQLVENLPSTVQQLTLKVAPHFDVETGSILIEKLVLAKKSRFPGLRGLRLLHISPEKAMILHGKTHVRAAARDGLMIDCDSQPDPDRAGIEWTSTEARDLPTLTQHLSRLIEGTGQGYGIGMSDSCLQNCNRRMMELISPYLSSSSTV